MDVSRQMGAPGVPGERCFAPGWVGPFGLCYLCARGLAHEPPATGRTRSFRPITIMRNCAMHSAAVCVMGRQMAGGFGLRFSLTKCNFRQGLGGCAQLCWHNGDLASSALPPHLSRRIVCRLSSDPSIHLLCCLRSPGDGDGVCAVWPCADIRLHSTPPCKSVVARAWLLSIAVGMDMRQGGCVRLFFLLPTASPRRVLSCTGTVHMNCTSVLIHELGWAGGQQHPWPVVLES